ncbi:MAG: prepilin-type N-terminal cleavage/methylation domain-containing protein [Planctomycetes bacterium]|nr:prepilin-type N-terminal cleavage/methylation domain-containing protein [Planctomycetota bacterium]
MKRVRGFTLVELLVVLAILALLIGLLIPGINHVRSRAKEMASQSNMKQWGIGYVNFATERKGLLPWEGEKDAAKMPLNLADRQRWWGNVVPPYVDQPAYASLALPDAAVPVPPDSGSIFIDPSAKTPSGFASGQSVFTGWTIPNSKSKFFFCYVPNSNLNNSLAAEMDALPSTDERSTAKKYDPKTGATTPEWIDARRMRVSRLKKPSNTVLLMEMRSIPEELDGAGTRDGKTPDLWHPYYGETLNRHRGDWQRFAARHRNGGHILYADGHADWYENTVACTPAGGSEPSKDKTVDFNRADLIWDPLGRSTLSDL